MRPSQGSRSENVQDAIKLAGVVLATSYEALHSLVKSDRAIVSNMTSGWPQIFLDADELASHKPQLFKRRFTASELRRAEVLCQLYVDLKGVSHADKKCALTHVLSIKPTWHGTSAKLGRRWVDCRSAHDHVLLRFYYALNELEKYVA